MSRPNLRWYGLLALVVLLGLALRLRGLHDPILDHPGWRQGDEAAIARNFAQLDLNPFHPQTDYDGPPPNYVELELQIVPWLAALGYKLFGVHEVFGRLISIAFSLGTVAVLAAFARAIFVSELAGIVAGVAFAIYPGSVYYGRTFTPDTTMTFFLSAALFAGWWWVARERGRFGRGFAVACASMALAILAKPVAVVALVPMAAMLLAGRPRLAALREPASYAYFAGAFAPYALYDAYVSKIAEWHWASGITRLHVLPALRSSVSSVGGLHVKLVAFKLVLGMLGTTMLGSIGAALALIAVVCVPAFVAPVRALLWSWLAAALAYAYAVVAVERVDYYLYPFLPLAALATGGLAALVSWRAGTVPLRRAWIGALAAVAIVATFVGRREVATYYRYSKPVYRMAVGLDGRLAPGALVVMGHYDPSVLYYIDRKGWEEDPYAWTPFDEQSAIRKGARYFVSIEHRRLIRNVELYAWLQRFPQLANTGRWPVFVTDPSRQLPDADERWRAFRRREAAGEATPQF